MKHRIVLAAGAVVAACTYNEYTTINEAPVAAADAGAFGGGSGGAGQGGSAGSSAGAAGDAGSAQNAGSSGSGGLGGEGECTGCVRLSVAANQLADYQLEFDERQNLATSIMLWRVRVRDYTGSVNVEAYARSGGSPDEEQRSFGGTQLTAEQGWQDVGLDLASLPDFQPPEFFDAGGFGGGVNLGFPFDKRRVEQVGLRVSPLAGQGVFTRAILEIDRLTFTEDSELDVSFTQNPADLTLLGDDATLTHVPE